MSANKEMISIQEQIKQQVAALQESTADKSITVNRQGNFQVGVVESKSNTLKVVILGFVHNAAWWEKSWTPGQSAIPDCAATGEINTQYAEAARPPMVKSFDELEPRIIEGENEDGEPREPQAAVCGECPNNVFGSGPNGKGKACKNSYILAVLPADDPEGHIHKVRISASGLKHFHEYLKTLATVGTTWFAVTTVLQSAEAGSGWTIKVLSKGMEALPEKELTAFYSRIEEAKKLLTFTPREDSTETVTSPGKDAA